MTNFMDCINASTTKEFAMIPNALLRDENLSFKAKGIISLLLSNDKGWKSYKSVMAEMSKDGKDSIENGLKELERNGYLKRYTIKDKKKRYAGSVWAYTDNKEYFNPDMSEYTKEGYTVTVKPVNGETVTKKTNSKKTNTKKKNNSSVTFQVTREYLESYLKRDLYEDELTSIRKNINKDINVEHLVDGFEQWLIGEGHILEDLDNDIRAYNISMVGYIYMFHHDYDKFINIGKSMY